MVEPALICGHKKSAGFHHTPHGFSTYPQRTMMSLRYKRKPQVLCIMPVFAFEVLICVAIEQMKM